VNFIFFATGLLVLLRIEFEIRDEDAFWGCGIGEKLRRVREAAVYITQSSFIQSLN